MLFIDAPHILFRIINDGTLQVTEHRYGSFITQVVPWVGVKLHFSLKSIMLLYSVSFYLFYLSIMSLLVFRYRAYTAAVVLALYYTLLVSDTFYWPNNEVHQGIAWLALAYTLLSRSLRKEQLRPLQIVLPAILFFIAIWTHPLVGIIAIYVLPFALRTVYKHRKPLALAVAAVVVGLVAVKWYQGMHHGYDSAKIETVTTFDFHHVASVWVVPPQLRCKLLVIYVYCIDRLLRCDEKKGLRVLRLGLAIYPGVPGVDMHYISRSGRSLLYGE
jgi:hypothetical protein